MDSVSTFEEPCLDKTRQIRYWTRCLKTLLPHHYTGNESNRMYLAFFIISALDLLDAWQTVASDEEKAGYVDWIYHCQHSKGGFRMWPGTDFGERANESNAVWDPANLPATYFALSSLLIIGDDFKRVRRKETLQWLRAMQREDGSFGETLVDGRIEGSKDPRFGYCATGVRYILRGQVEGPIDIHGEEVQDIDVDRFVRCINLSESFDGGIADQPYHEPHSGYTFCALGALSFAQRLNTPSTSQLSAQIVGPSDPKLTLEWVISRQTDLIDIDEGLDSEFESKSTKIRPEIDGSITTTSGKSEAIDDLHQSPDKTTFYPPLGPNELIAGMNGRPSKVADTCYAWWSGASAHILGSPVYDHLALCRYLLGQTQHTVLGGFGKLPGDLPDLYHSYLALAALGLSGCEDVKKVDARMCISKEASGRLSSLWNILDH